MFDELFSRVGGLKTFQRLDANGKSTDTAQMFVFCQHFPSMKQNFHDENNFHVCLQREHQLEWRKIKLSMWMLTRHCVEMNFEKKSVDSKDIFEKASESSRKASKKFFETLMDVKTEVWVQSYQFILINSRWSINILAIKTLGIWNMCEAHH